MEVKKRRHLRDTHKLSLTWLLTYNTWHILHPSAQTVLYRLVGQGFEFCQGQEAHVSFWWVVVRLRSDESRGAHRDLDPPKMKKKFRPFKILN